MRFFCFVFGFILAVSDAEAKDIALILDEASQREMVQLIDAAVRATGVNYVSQAAHIMEKLRAAPEVKEQTKPELDK